MPLCDSNVPLTASEEVMETKLAEVWESNPIERMQLLERVWQQSLRNMSECQVEVG